MRNSILKFKPVVLFLIFLCVFALGLFAQKRAIENKKPQGKLFIIGGGGRPEAMIDRLIDEAKVKNTGYVFVLPMASELADSAIIWSGAQFAKKGIKVSGYNFKKGEAFPQDKLDSLVNAPLIYISGGDQARFMNVVRFTPLFEAIHKAYHQGAIIAGTSAGAAVMSHLMITGNELRHPVYNETFKCIEKGNIEFAEGLGLLRTAIVDQHFVVRSRHNRLITAVFEQPELTGIGIDEATAILVSGNEAEVIGNSNILVFRNNNKKSVTKETKMGGKIQLEIYLPGDKFLIQAKR